MCFITQETVCPPLLLVSPGPCCEDPLHTVHITAQAPDKAHTVVTTARTTTVHTAPSTAVRTAPPTPDLILQFRAVPEVQGEITVLQRNLLNSGPNFQFKL